MVVALTALQSRQVNDGFRNEIVKVMEWVGRARRGERRGSFDWQTDCKLACAFLSGLKVTAQSPDPEDDGNNERIWMGSCLIVLKKVKGGVGVGKVKGKEKWELSE